MIILWQPGFGCHDFIMTWENTLFYQKMAILPLYLTKSN